MVDRDISSERIFESLADSRRQCVIDHLHDQSSAKPVIELATEIAARERGTSASDVPEDTTDQVYTALYHVHLPQLEDANLVTFDAEREHVETTENIHLAKRLLDVVSEG